MSGVTRVNALFSPAEVAALRNQDLSRTVCVVFDVLRATSTLLTALAQGAESVIPVFDIEEALGWKARRPEVLLAGEREGLRIGARLTGGIEFDFGNSPREFAPERVQGRIIVSTTTNGTNALRGCAHAGAVLPGALLNNRATAAAILALGMPELLLIGAGTVDQAAYEDVLGLGALAEELWPALVGVRISDSVRMARTLYLGARGNLMAATAEHSRNGRRLLRLPELASDVEFCLTENSLPFAARLDRDGAIRRCVTTS